MALGTVQAGYKNSLYVYPVWNRDESDFDYAELLAELTTELELACKGGEEEPVTEDGSGEDSDQTDSYSERKKEWEELLEQSVNLEAMLRQMLENGLGQKDEEQQELPKKQEEEELDNTFEMDGIPIAADGKSRSSENHTEYSGSSQFLQTNTGSRSEYFSPSAGGRKQSINSRIMCLTCQTECDRKKQWKITE